MKKIIYSAVAILILVSSSGCKKWLDVNVNPNNPQVVAPNLYLGPMLTNFVFAQQWDGRYTAKYVQNWAQISSLDTYDRMGYSWTTGSNNGGEMWRMTYFLLGYNLIDMMRLSEEQQRWDLLGIGYTLKAFAWLHTTDQHGEIILSQAFDLSRKTFDYDTQEAVYVEILRLLDQAIVNLNRVDGAVNQAYIGSNDVFYGGDRVKWLKLAWGLKAMAMNHLSNKGALYKPVDIITAVDNSFIGNVDNAKIKFSGAGSTSSNFFSPTRDNLTSVRQTSFFVKLMDGTQFGSVVDPRLKRLLFPSTDGNVYGLEPTYGYGTLTTQQMPLKNLWGTTTSGTGQTANYIFNEKSSFPVVTYSELQFVKAEAAYKKGDKGVAVDAYKKGIEAHIDFVNQANAESANPNVTQISALEKSTFVNAVVPTVSDNLRLSDIMSQKYIALWGWAFLETWTDLRRYHYTDIDPEVPTVKVFKGFAVPAVDRISSDNLNKPVYRLRPRYDSEYTWNIESLNKIGLKQIDYHTIPIWLAN